MRGEGGEGRVRGEGEKHISEGGGRGRGVYGSRWRGGRGVWMRAVGQ